MALLRAGSLAYDWNIELSEIAGIWMGGCIIRARLLNPIRQAFVEAPALPNLLIAPGVVPMLESARDGWRRTVRQAIDAGIPMPAHSFDSYTTARLPQNLTQAQRDAFGAHTCE